MAFFSFIKDTNFLVISSRPDFVILNVGILLGYINLEV